MSDKKIISIDDTSIYPKPNYLDMFTITLPAGDEEE